MVLASSNQYPTQFLLQHLCLPPAKRYAKTWSQRHIERWLFRKLVRARIARTEGVALSHAHWR